MRAESFPEQQASERVESGPRGGKASPGGGVEPCGKGIQEGKIRRGEYTGRASMRHPVFGRNCSDSMIRRVTVD